MDPEEAVRQRDAIDLAGDQSESFTQYRAAHLAADDGLFDQHLRVVLPGGLHRAQQFVRAVTLLTPNEEPERAGFTKTG